MVSALRNIRSEMGVSPKDDIEVLIKSENADKIEANEWILRKLQVLKSLYISTDFEKPKACASALVGNDEIYVQMFGLVDVDKEIDRIKKEMNRVEGFLKGVNGKLNNSNFVDNAPEAVVQNERNKKRDGEANLEKLKEQLKDFQ